MFRVQDSGFSVSSLRFRAEGSGLDPTRMSTRVMTSIVASRASTTCWVADSGCRVKGEG